MNPEAFHKVQAHYDMLEETFRDKCLELPFHLDGQDYDNYCYIVLHPFKESLLAIMESAAEDEDFERALAIKMFVEERLKAY